MYILCDILVKITAIKKTKINLFVLSFAIIDFSLYFSYLSLAFILYSSNQDKCLKGHFLIVTNWTTGIKENHSL